MDITTRVQQNHCGPEVKGSWIGEHPMRSERYQWVVIGGLLSFGMRLIGQPITLICSGFSDATAGKLKPVLDTLQTTQIYRERGETSTIDCR